MGNSLSQDSQAILEAATAGDVHLLKQQIESEPKLLESVTLVKRRGVLHLAAKQGHPHIISTVLDPLLDAVRQEYHAHLREQQHLQHQGQQAEQQEQHPSAEQPAANTQQEGSQRLQREPALQVQQLQESRQRHSAGDLPPASSSRADPNQQPLEVQLASFKRLRHTVNARDLYRRTPLIVAAKQGHLECTHLLVDAASNMFAVDREGNTSLHYAALHGHTDVVDYLLERAIDRGLGARLVNKRNLSGFTALHYAVWSGRTPVVAPLLAAGADICAVNDRVFDAWVPVPIGSTPLHLAVMRASIPIALMLLEHYAISLTSSPRDRARPTDPRSIINLYGMNPAQLAAHRNNRPMAQLLMPSMPLSRLLAAQPHPPPRVFGPQSLKAIAAAVVQHTLTQQLDALEAAQEAAPASTSAHCCKQTATQAEDKASCSVVCVRACGSDDAMLDAGSSTAGVGIVMVQADVSACTSPAASRAASPDGTACAAMALPAVQDSVSAFAAAAGGLQTSACGDASVRGVRGVTFDTAGEVDAEAAAANSTGGSKLGHALTTASSSGWYDELCCVCWESEVTAVMEPCVHALCLACARQLVSSSGTAGATCPLCRCHIAGFNHVPSSARQATGKRKKTLMAGAGI